MKAVVHKEITRSGDLCVASTDGRVHMHQPMHTNDMWPHADDCSTGTWNTHLPLPSLTSIFFCFQVGMSQETNRFTTLLVPVLVIVHPFIFPHPSLGSCLPQEMGMGGQSGERGISAQRFTSNFWSPESLGMCSSTGEMLRRKQELCELGLLYSAASAPEQRGFPQRGRGEKRGQERGIEIFQSHLVCNESVRH